MIACVCVVDASERDLSISIYIHTSRTYSSRTQRNKLSAAMVRICIRLFVAWATRFPRIAVGG